LKHKIYTILGQRHFSIFILTAVLMLFSALVNVAGIGSFLPFMQLLMNPDSIVETAY
jgi:hypothetical protein